MRPTPAAPAPTRRGRRVLLRLLALAVALFLAIVAVELFVHLPVLSDPLPVQMRGMVEESPEGVIRTVANYRGTQNIGGRVQHLRHDSAGMRGPEPGAKVEGELRILFVGDSVTYGTGVEEDETFARLVAVALRTELGRPVTCGIAACPGFGSVDHAALLRRVATHFQPDLVVSCVFVENDLFDNLSVERAVVAGYPLFHGPQVRLARSSWRARAMLRFKTAWLLEQALRNYLPALALDPSALTPTPEEARRWAGVPADQAFLFLEQTGDVPAIDRMCATAGAGLDDLRRTAAPTPVVVVLIPSFLQYVPGLFAPLTALRTGEHAHVLGSIQTRLHAVCAARSLPYRDLLDDLRAHADPASLVIPNDFHFSVAGNRFVAERLTPWLAEQIRSGR